MNVLIVYPETKNTVTGNYCTAFQYKDILTDLGHNVSLSEEYEGQGAELLIAINAQKKNRDIERFAEAYPDSKIIVILLNGFFIGLALPFALGLNLFITKDLPT